MSELHDKARAMVALRDKAKQPVGNMAGAFEYGQKLKAHNDLRSAAADMADTIAALLAENEGLSMTNAWANSTLLGVEVRAAAAEARLREMQPAPFTPFWPPALRAGERYRVLCDDKGRNGGTWLDVFLANDGDVHVSMQDWENVPEGAPDPFPSLRVRTYIGGGRNERTRQALLWLAEAIRLDTAPRPSLEKKS